MAVPDAYQVRQLSPWTQETHGQCHGGVDPQSERGWQRFGESGHSRCLRATVYDGGHWCVWTRDDPEADASGQCSSVGEAQVLCDLALRAAGFTWRDPVSVDHVAAMAAWDELAAGGGHG